MQLCHLNFPKISRSDFLMARACFFLLFATLILHHLMAISIALHFKNITTDQSALLVLKSHITNLEPHSILAKNWSTTSSVCDWIGVTCGSRHHRVTSLDISNMGLVGTIPPQIGNLSFLVKLDMRNNYFHGNLPNELSRLHKLRVISLGENNITGLIPCSLSNMSKLDYLNLSSNLLIGSIPPSIFNISSLETISFARNELSGNLSNDIGHLSNLTFLNLLYNQLSGPLPLSLFQCSQLQILSLSHNMFSGAIPREIGNLKMLRTLALANNTFEGPIPKEIHHCSNLEILAMHQNYLDGFIPTEIGNLTMVTELYLFGNNLIGEIPEEITRLKKVEWLSLNSNSLCGSIPGGIFNLSALQRLFLSDNNLSGTLPSNMGTRLPYFEVLYLQYNSLTGQLPESISNFSKLTDIDITYNKFTGSIPNSLGNLRLLRVLRLFDNSFTSYSSPDLPIITALTNCRKLEFLYIAYNPLTGILPISIGNLSTSLVKFGLAGCKIKGSIPDEIGNLSSLMMLDLSNNDLSGYSPRTFSGLQMLQKLLLNNNKIRGDFSCNFCDLHQLGYLYLDCNEIASPILDCIGNLTSLREIDISSNRLSFEIPSNFWSLKDLLVLDLSSNSLSGILPQELENLEVAIFIDLSGNQFIGDIPNAYGSMRNLINFSLASNKLEGSIPQSFGKMTGLELLDLSNNNLSGEIPKSLEKLDSLKYFNVSFNKLRGEIPSGGPFKNFTYQSFLSNEALCGTPQFQVPPCDHNRNSSHDSSSTRRLVLVISLVISSLALIVILVHLWIKRQKRKGVPPKVDSPQINTMPGRFSYNQIQQATDCFSQGNLLGIGSFGSVYRATIENRILFAVKVFNLQLELASKSFETECEVLRNLRHRNLTKVIGVCSNLDFKALVLEYMENGSLEDWLYLDGHFLDMKQRLDVMIDVASALEYLHHGYHTPVVHSDLKPSNILLDKDMVGHVADFGIAKFLGEGESNVHIKTLATLGYIAPEYGIEGFVSSASDVYSYGIILMEIFTARKPSDNMFFGDLNLRSWINASLSTGLNQVVDSNLLATEIELQCLSRIMELALNCTRESPRARINMKDVLTTLKKIKVQVCALVQ